MTERRIEVVHGFPAELCREYKGLDLEEIAERLKGGLPCQSDDPLLGYTVRHRGTGEVGSVWIGAVLLSVVDQGEMQSVPLPPVPSYTLWAVSECARKCGVRGSDVGTVVLVGAWPSCPG